VNAEIVIVNVQRDVRQRNVEHPGNSGFAASADRFRSESEQRNHAGRIFYFKYKIYLYIYCQSIYISRFLCLRARVLYLKKTFWCSLHTPGHVAIRYGTIHPISALSIRAPPCLDDSSRFVRILCLPVRIIVNQTHFSKGIINYDSPQTVFPERQR